MKNPIGWVEIPVTDMPRAMKFYSELFGFKLELQHLPELEMALFPWFNEDYGSGGALVKHEKYKPGTSGPLLYFGAPDGDIEAGLKKAETLGGRVILPKKAIGEHGFMGAFGPQLGRGVDGLRGRFEDAQVLGH